MAERRRRVAFEKQKCATINREGEEEEEDEGEEEEEERGKMMMVMRGEEKNKSSVVVVVPPVKRVADGGAHQTSPPACQAEKCAADLLEAKRYHRRHKVCEPHAKALEVVVAGLLQRFCQQCSRFHELSEFDEAKRSCRRRLAGHNERRRKSSSLESHGEGSNRKGVGSQLKENPCKQADQSGRTQITFPGSSNFKHFQIR